MNKENDNILGPFPGRLLRLSAIVLAILTIAIAGVVALIYRCHQSGICVQELLRQFV